MRRRTFLTVGAIGATTLAAAGLWSWLRRSGGDSAQALDGDATTVVTAIAPALLSGALPESGLERTAAIRDVVAGVDRAIAGLPPHARGEIRQLFALLALAPARRAFAGVASPWQEASIAEVSSFLDRWRDSGWALKRTAYDALHQLVFAAWYGNPRSWASIGYEGPPRMA